MSNNSQAIELKGICRSQTKLGMQDGQLEDAFNLKFKDGSYRVSNDGKPVFFGPSSYRDIFIHTNSTYRHVLGVNVNDNKLYWFANIDADGATFHNISPIVICDDVVGDLSITQIGHMINICHSNAKEVTSIFAEHDNRYKNVSLQENSGEKDRTIFPFGSIHLNLNYDSTKHIVTSTNEDVDPLLVNGIFGNVYPNANNGLDNVTLLWHTEIIKAYALARDKNIFTKPFLACVAVKLYDGSYILASNPVLLFPRQGTTMNKLYVKTYYNSPYIQVPDTEKENYVYCVDGYYIDTTSSGYLKRTETRINDLTTYGGNPMTNSEAASFLVSEAPSCSANTSQYIRYEGLIALENTIKKLTAYCFGADIAISLGDISVITDNSDIFSGISIFVTPEVEVFVNSNKHDDSVFHMYQNHESLTAQKDSYAYNLSYRPKFRDYKYIVEDLKNSQFFLLKDISIGDIKKYNMSNNTTIVDLPHDEKEGKSILGTLTTRTRLTNEAIDRKSYISKDTYSYNGRLHKYNIEESLYNGYPLDFFSNQNRFVETLNGNLLWNAIRNATYSICDQAQLPYDSGISLGTSEQAYIDAAILGGTVLAYIKISNKSNTRSVVKYIEPYHSSSTSKDFTNICPVLAYPEYDFNKMEICVVTYDAKTQQAIAHYKDFELINHLYLGFSFYISPDLSLIDINDGTWQTNTLSLSNLSSSPSAYFKKPISIGTLTNTPNKLKVSKTDNPLFFPLVNTYLIGNSEIMALMSNAIAIGTGQTGSAPLYVFCKDGVFALLVDSSGELAYVNARIIARDVCNNSKSVTPIDSGVVFTTDRGLMLIAGTDVTELSQAVEGELFDITDNGNLPSNPANADKAKKIMFNAFTMAQIANIPSANIDNVDFLTYIKGAIVNYNHNDRELMVSNPNYPYTYIMNRNGDWSRRTYKADMYVNSYPTSYRIDQSLGSDIWFKVDEDNLTMSDNPIYLLSNVIKLGSIGFKQLYCLVVRGYFETVANRSLGCYVFGSYDGRQWALIGGNEKSGQFTDIGCKISRTDVKFLRFCISGQLSKDSRIDFVEIAAEGSMLNAKIR